MPDSVEVQPAKRSPGRPRKNLVAKSESVASATTPPEPKFADDERVGEKVDDCRWTEIAFGDGRTYRVENGLIAKRIG